jgi:flagellar biosynthesis protein FlhF
MNVKSYKAKSLPEALQMVQREMGPDAAVLQTREVWDGWWRGLIGFRQVEVTACNGIQVHSPFPMSHWIDGLGGPSVKPTADSAGVESREPARFAHSLSPPIAASPPNPASPSIPASPPIPPAHGEHQVQRFHADLSGNTDNLDAMIRELCHRPSAATDMPQALFRVYTDLVDADIEEDIARDLVAQLRNRATLGELEDGHHIDRRLRDLVKSWIKPHGPITISPNRQRVVALIGPTGVGKTTTIAKLAANFRLRDRQRVGLITVDTYRIAAVEQLRTYADIIDLPMEVVATQREMREALCRLSEMDLILMDTAGRSPRDEVRIQELKMMLQEAKPDEVHLVLSSTIGAQSLVKTTRKFGEVGATALLLTKLDEATGLGNLIPLLRESELPLSYLTNGQSVPDDIQTTDPSMLTEWILTGTSP